MSVCKERVTDPGVERVRIRIDRECAGIQCEILSNALNDCRGTELNEIGNNRRRLDDNVSGARPSVRGRISRGYCEFQLIHSIG